MEWNKNQYLASAFSHESLELCCVLLQQFSSLHPQQALCKLTILCLGAAGSIKLSSFPLFTSLNTHSSEKSKIQIKIFMNWESAFSLTRSTRAAGSMQFCIHTLKVTNQQLKRQHASGLPSCEWDKQSCIPYVKNNTHTILWLRGQFLYPVRSNQPPKSSVKCNKVNIFNLFVQQMLNC